MVLLGIFLLSFLISANDDANSDGLGNRVFIIWINNLKKTFISFYHAIRYSFTALCLYKLSR